MRSSYRVKLAIGIWLICLASLAVYIRLQGHFGGSLTAFLPQSGSVVQRALVKSLHEGEAARLLLVAVTGGSSVARVQASKALVVTLKRHSHVFTVVTDGGAHEGRSIRHFLYRYRYALAPPQLLSVARLHQYFVQDMALLDSPAGLGASHLLADPTDAFMAAVRPWMGSAGPPQRLGAWVSPHGHKALLVAETRQSGFNAAAQQHAVKLIRSVFAGLPHIQGLHIQIGGAGAITVAANKRVADNVRWLVIADIILVSAVLFFVYRSVRPILVSAVPVVTGAVVATAVLAAFYPVISVTTLGFGTMLIGVAMDYPAYVLLHVRSGEKVSHAAVRVAPALRLAVMAMALGFATMYVSHISGLVQLAVFAVAGLVAAASAARWLLPVFMPLFAPHPSLALGEQQVVRGMVYLRSGAWLVFVFVALAAVVLHMARHVWNNQVAALSPAPQAAMIRTNVLARDLGTPTLHYVIMVVGNTRQVVLRRSEGLMPILAQLKAEHVLGADDLAARYLPSKQEQERRLRMLPRAAVLRHRIIQAEANLPFRRDAFNPFLHAVEKARDQPPLGFANLPVALQAKLRALLVPVGHRIVGFVQLVGVHKPQILASSLDTAHLKGIYFVNVKAQTTALLRAYRWSLLRHTGMAFILMAFVVAIGLRSIKSALRIILPMAAAIFVTCGLLVALGIGLTLLNVVALLLIAGLGMGYALFFGNNRLIDHRQALAPWVCAATTIVGFGVMAMSPISLLSSVGLTVSLGAACTVIFTAAWSVPDSHVA